MKCVFSFSEYHNYFRDKHGNVFLLLLLSGDLAFAAITVFEMTTQYLHNYLYSSLMDGSYAEMYQYIKWFWIVILLFLLAVRSRSAGFVVWILIFVYILIDDSFLIHEKMGAAIAGVISFNPPSVLGPQDFGELLVSGGAGIILGSLLLLVLLYGSKECRTLSFDLLFLFICLIFFGIFLDVGKDFLNPGEHLRLALAFIEDTCEMIVASLIVWYLFIQNNTPISDRSYIITFHK